MRKEKVEKKTKKRLVVKNEEREGGKRLRARLLLHMVTIFYVHC